MKKYLYRLMLVLAFFTVASCEVTELDKLDDPNALSPSQADADFFLNSVQVKLGEYMEGDPTGNWQSPIEFTAEVTRQMHMFGPLYNNAHTPGDFDLLWGDAYNELLEDAVSLISTAEEQELFVHAGIARVIEGYVFLTLTDIFGDVPFTQALQGAENLNPQVSPSAEIYDGVLDMMDQAIADFGKESAAQPATDLIYDGDVEKWIKLANTLKLRIHLQRRTVDSNAGSSIAAIVSSGNFIQTKDEDFQFNWSTNLSNPDSRHPNFFDNYITGGNDYMNNYFMNILLTEKGEVDPRTRYYFYRQTLTDTEDVNELPCINFQRPAHYPPGTPFCQLFDGYWGRDHGDDSGIPPDDQLRTVWGLYPVGGKFDADNGSRVRETIGAQGAGATPMMLASYVDFMRAEAALTLGTGEDPRVLLESAVRKSMDKVLNFDEEIGFAIAEEEESFTATQEDVDAYVDEVLANYDAASGDGKLGVIIREYYIASFGNGIEAYNAYRRTGFPTDLQPTTAAQPGPFVRTFLYPSNFVTRNSAVGQKPDNTVMLSWDPGLNLD